MASLGLFVSQAWASIDLDNPISLSTEFVVGIKSSLPADGGESDAQRIVWAQQILDLVQGGTLNELDPPDDGRSWEYEANTAYNYSGTIASGGPTNTGPFTLSGDQIVIPAGYDYVLIKYDGPNAGYILYATGGDSAELPQYPWTIWANNQGGGYGISGWTGYISRQEGNEIPEPASAAVWTLMSVCCAGMVALGRRGLKSSRVS